MRMRTALAITLTMFALPAVAGERPLMPPPRELPREARADANTNPDLSVCFEVRTVKVPAGFCERAGLKLTGNTVLNDADLRRILEAAQSHRDANIMQFPTLTAFDGQEATVKNCEDQFFATSIEVTKVKGQTVFIPQNKPIKLGDTLTVCGHVLADLRRVSVRANLTRTSLVGNVELVPIVTQITPVFEGGAQGKPVPFTQFLQVPDVKTEQVEANAIVPAGGTVVLGSWKETGDRPARVKGQKKEAPAAEYEVVTFATVRVIRADPAAVAPLPREGKAVVCKLRNVAAADAADAVNAFLAGERLSAQVVAEPVPNVVRVSAEPALLQRLCDMIAALDKAPVQVTVQATVIQVPRGFAAEAGLEGGANAWTLSPREAKMLTGLIRAAKGRGELDVLARPTVQVADNQTGFVRIGPDHKVVTPAALVQAGGAPAATTTTTVATGLSFRVTPRVSPDGSVLLRTNAQYTWESPRGVTVTGAGGADVQVPAFNTLAVEHTAKVAAGETVVLALSGGDFGGHSFLGAIRGRVGDNPYETLVVITPHLVRGESENARILAEESAKMK